MANINVVVDKTIADGYKLKFRTPCESTTVEGLEVKYPAKNGVGTLIKKFVFKDAHGTELSGVGNLFVSGVMIEVLLDVTHGVAYIQNADTNSYVESVKGEVARLEESQKQFLSVAGKVVEECEKATANANKEYDRIKDGVVGKREKDGSEVFNDYDNNQASGEFTHAEGTGTKAMGKVFGIVSIDANTKVITLSDSAYGILDVGMEYSCQLAKTYNDVGKVTIINGNSVTVDTLPADVTLSTSPLTSIDGNFMWVASNPEVGTLDVFSKATHAEGMDTIASGVGAHAEGRETHACGKYSHAEGRKTKAYYGAHAEGLLAQAIGHESHAEGFNTTAYAEATHAEGFQSNAIGMAAHAEGRETIAQGIYSHAENFLSRATGQYSHAEGNGTSATATGTHAEGYQTQASGGYAHAEGISSVASGEAAHAEGESTASGVKSHSEGRKTTASGSYSHAEGDRSTASAIYSHAEGVATEASGDAAHAEGFVTKATKKGTHAEGINTEATTDGAHAEGNKTKATGHDSHAEGTETQATASGSHAEGSGTKATNYNAHAEGGLTTASGNHSHAEGYNTEASGWGSHAGGHGTKATVNSQTAIGRFNAEENDALFIVGNGTDDDKRSNAMSVKGNGAIKSAGANQKLYSGALKIGDIIGNRTFNVSHYAAVSLQGTSGRCIAGVVRDGSEYVIEGILVEYWSSGADIKSVKITTDANAKVTNIAGVLVSTETGITTVSAWPEQGGSTNIFSITGLVPIC